MKNTFWSHKMDPLAYCGLKKYLRASQYIIFDSVGFTFINEQKIRIEDSRPVNVSHGK